MEPIFDTHESDLENAIERLYNNADSFYLLSEEKQGREIEKAKKSHHFSALNYIHTSEGIEKVANYITNSGDNIEQKPNCDYTFYKFRENFLFVLSPAVAVNKEVKVIKKIHPNFENVLNEKGYDFIKKIDVGFFEKHYGAEVMMEDFEKEIEDPLKRLHLNEFKFNKLEKISAIAPAKYSLMKWMSEDELLLLDYTKEGIIDKKKFTSFGDKEKMHFKFLMLKDRRNGAISITPYFIGIGNNYPFTRVLQNKQHGDNRFYRDSLDEAEMKYTFQRYIKHGKKWNNRVCTYNTKKTVDVLMDKIKNHKREGELLFDLIDKSQKVYGDYFEKIFDIEKLMKDFSEKKGVVFNKETERLNYRLMLNPLTRIRPTAVVAYSELRKII
ncbi:hypothetical protein ISS04_02290 [Candidatus Woesearchaeota archaeon]|nr:hypothetical protein [Candidatus Woesearchaeota archaeon]